MTSVVQVLKMSQWLQGDGGGIKVAGAKYMAAMVWL